MALNQKSGMIRHILLVVALIEFYAEFNHLRGLMFFTKPLLLPLIALYFFISLNGELMTRHKLMLFAFLFSWFGDISLMLTPETATDTELMGIPKHNNLFLAGLGSFLIAQILFIKAFRKSISAPSNMNIRPNKYIYILFFIYWAMMLLIVLPPLQDSAEKQPAAVPVMIYAAILIMMAATAYSRCGQTTKKSFRFTLIGACLFVISDSLIAVNFLALPEPTHYAGFTIMITYVAAEYLIAEGILKHDPADSNSF